MKKNYKIISIDDYAVVISDDEIKDGVLVARDGSGMVKVVRHDRVSIRCVNIVTGAEASIVLGTQEKDWANVVATIDRDMTEHGIPLVVLPKLEVTGYRINPGIDRLMVDGILKYAMPIWDETDKSIYFIMGHVGGSLVAKLRVLGVLNLWFTPVYNDIKTWCKEQHLQYYYKEGLMSDESPDKEEDVEKLSEQYVIDGLEKLAEQYVIEESYLPDYKEECKRSYMNGYKDAQQDKKWSDDDMIDCLNFFIRDFGAAEEVFDLYLQSLQKKKYPESIELDEQLNIVKTC